MLREQADALLAAYRAQRDARRLVAVTGGGDPRELRGIPAIGRNVTGAIPGSAPHRDAPSLREIPA